VKIFQREQRSLFGEILDWMLTPLLLLWPVSLALTWLVAQGLANKPFDRALEYNAHALAQLVGVQQMAARCSSTCPSRPARSCAPTTPTSFTTRCSGRGEFLSGERDLPLPPDDDDPPCPAKCACAMPSCAAWTFAWPTSGCGCRCPAPLALVQVAETREKRSVLATEIIKGVMLPQFVILPLAVLLVWLALARGIQPLNQLEQRIRARSPDDLSPAGRPHRAAGGGAAGVVGE
jgi:two-component system sensor histidine kinase TctE